MRLCLFREKPLYIARSVWKDDPEMLAFAYTAPISALIHLCDREPEKTDEAMARIEAFSRHFITVYGETGSS